MICLQTVPNQAIFSIQAGVCHLFREFLVSQGFHEIHTPKIISGWIGLDIVLVICNRLWFLYCKWCPIESRQMDVYFSLNLLQFCCLEGLIAVQLRTQYYWTAIIGSAAVVVNICMWSFLMSILLSFIAASEGGANVFEVTYFKGKFSTSHILYLVV